MKSSLVFGIFLMFVISLASLGHASAVNSAEEDLSQNYTKLYYLINGGNEDTLKVVYFGNSRVARPTGFAFDGLASKVHFEMDRFAGEGFVMPRFLTEQKREDGYFLRNLRGGMTKTTGWEAKDVNSVAHQHSANGLALIPNRSVKMANFPKDFILMPNDEELVLTVNYLSGPGLGKFKIVPVDVQGGKNIVFYHNAIIVDTQSSISGVNYVQILMPQMKFPSKNRAFILEGVEGNTTIYETNVFRNVYNGIAVSELAIGGKGYQNQATELSEEDWTKYVESFVPDIAIWECAANQGFKGLVDSTKELMNRVESLNPEVLHIITKEHPTPRVNYAIVVSKCSDWADSLEGYNGAIVVDPTPYLPQDFLDLAGTGQLGNYFLNSVHENRYGAYVVFNATWEAMKNL